MFSASTYSRVYVCDDFALKNFPKLQKRQQLEFFITHFYLYYIVYKTENGANVKDPKSNDQKDR